MKTSLWRQLQQQLRCCWCQLSCALALLQWNLAYPQFFFPAQYEHKLIGHLVPFTDLLPGYTRRASPCPRRKLISKPLWSHIPWVFLPSITNPGRQPWAQHLAIVQIQTLVMPKLVFRFCVHFCVFLMASLLPPKKYNSVYCF